MGKVLLPLPRKPMRSETRHQILRIVRCLPYFFNGAGWHLHRVKEGRVHIIDGKYSHTSFTYYCGNIGRLSPRMPASELLDWKPPDIELCSRCFPNESQDGTQ